MDHTALCWCDNSESWSISLLRTDQWGSGRLLAEVAGLQVQTSGVDPMFSPKATSQGDEMVDSSPGIGPACIPVIRSNMKQASHFRHDLDRVY